MDTDTEALRREIAVLQQRVADLMDIQARGEAYRNRVLREFAELERENQELRWQLSLEEETVLR